MAKTIPISPAVQAARARRLARADRDIVRFEWFLREVNDKINLNLRQRMQLATAYLLSKVVKNISVPVVRGTGVKSGRVVVVERSKPGEFPRAETTQLMKTVFSDVVETSPGNFDGYVGTPLDYGLILETQMNRSFLVRTLNEEKDVITRMLTGRIE